MAEIKELLDEVIEDELENLMDLERGSDEEAKAIKNLTDLHKLRIEEIRTDSDTEDRNQRRYMDAEAHDDDERYRKNQLKADSIDRYLKFGLGILELALPLAFYGVWMRMGFEFEKEGTFTSTTFRNLFNRFKPTQKS